MTVRGTAAAQNPASCHDCDLVVQAPHGHGAASCPRCGARIHLRKTDSIARSSALVLASAILYVPAMLLPAMTMTSLGRTQTDTILSGIVYLFKHGMWPLGLIVFVASVAVPMVKLSAMVYLLVSVQRGSTQRPLDRTIMYRITELIGRWSMVDVFVITVLVALVRMGSLATIEAGAGIVFFGAVVVLTMLAAETFDPRLIWDPMEAHDDGRTRSNA